eukprot:scaffold655_cov225-Pinguiococcus_pyrenoidosus.AAC.17
MFRGRGGRRLSAQLLERVPQLPDRCVALRDCSAKLRELGAGILRVLQESGFLRRHRAIPLQQIAPLQLQRPDGGLGLLQRPLSRLQLALAGPLLAGGRGQVVRERLVLSCDEREVLAEVGDLTLAKPQVAYGRAPRCSGARAPCRPWPRTFAVPLAEAPAALTSPSATAPSLGCCGSPSRSARPAGPAGNRARRRGCESAPGGSDSRERARCSGEARPGPGLRPPSAVAPRRSGVPKIGTPGRPSPPAAARGLPVEGARLGPLLLHRSDCDVAVPQEGLLILLLPLQLRLEDTGPGEQDVPLALHLRVLRPRVLQLCVRGARAILRHPQLQAKPLVVGLLGLCRALLVAQQVLLQAADPLGATLQQLVLGPDHSLQLLNPLQGAVAFAREDHDVLQRRAQLLLHELPFLPQSAEGLFERALPRFPSRYCCVVGSVIVLVVLLTIQAISRCPLGSLRRELGHQCMLLVQERANLQRELAAFLRALLEAGFELSDALLQREALFLIDAALKARLELFDATSPGRGLLRAGQGPQFLPQRRERGLQRRHPEGILLRLLETRLPHSKLVVEEVDLPVELGDDAVCVLDRRRGHRSGVVLAAAVQELAQAQDLLVPSLDALLQSLVLPGHRLHLDLQLLVLRRQLRVHLRLLREFRQLPRRQRQRQLISSSFSFSCVFLGGGRLGSLAERPLRRAAEQLLGRHSAQRAAELLPERVDLVGLLPTALFQAAGVVRRLLSRVDGHLLAERGLSGRLILGLLGLDEAHVKAVVLAR